MISRPAELPIIALSVKVYQVLLIAYPAKFQQEYGSEMTQVFQDCCLRTFRQGGTNGMLKLWTVTLLDLVQSVVSEHTQKEIHMKKEMKPEDIRKAGWSLMLGAVAFVFGMYWETSVWDLWIIGFPLLLLSVPMMAFGLRGLQARYGEAVGRFGKNILQFGAVLGPVTTLVGFIGGWVGLFVLIYTGPAILLTCLTIFGIAALLKKPYLNWKALTVFAGIWYPVFFINVLITRMMNGRWPVVSFEIADLVGIMMIPCIAMIALGYILKSHVPQETATV